MIAGDRTILAVLVFGDAGKILIDPFLLRWL
jgi:hypothetical protein